MLTQEMMTRIEDLFLELTRYELMDLRLFLKMAEEVRRLSDGELAGLFQVLEDKGNPNKWNLTKLVQHEVKRRNHTIPGVSSDIPLAKDIFPNVTQDKTGTMVPPGEDRDSRLSEMYRPTKPQPGDR
jgi:hypothetical protein